MRTFIVHPRSFSRLENRPGSDTRSRVDVVGLTAEGIEQRSRYWIGSDVKVRLFGARVPVDKIGAALGMKRRMAGARVAYEQLLHDQIEFTHLAGFLPELWNEFGRT
jgi:hypothetical protein